MSEALASALRTVHQWFRKSDPEDPFARVRVPLRKGPGNRGASAAAVVEQREK